MFSSAERDEQQTDANESEETVIQKTANVGETSVEIDVEGLIAELEAEKASGNIDNDGDLRKRLDEILESKREQPEPTDFEDYDLDED